MRDASGPTRSRRRQTPGAVDESKTTDDALQVTDEYIRALMENALDGIVVLNGDGTVRYESPFMKRVMGRGSGERAGKSAFEFIHPDDIPRVSGLFAELLKSPGSSMREELRVLREDDSVCHLEITGQNLVDNPAVRGIVANLRDVTDRKQAEDGLRESEKHYAALVENLTDAVFKFKGGVVVWCNDRVEEIYGYTRNEVMGKDASFFLPQEADPEGYFGEAYQALTERGQFADTVRVLRKNGQWADIEFSISMIPDRYPVELVAVARDVTAREEAAREKQQMGQKLLLSGRLAAVGELAAGVAHELNNPLAAVQGYAQFLTSRDDLEESVRSDVEIIYKEALRASRITANLLQFARKHEPEKKMISMNDVIGDSIELNAYRMKVSNIEIAQELDPALPKTMADFHQLQQVFVNLITNAEQAVTRSRGKGKLSVKTQRSGDTIQIAFTDDGPGITEENLNSIFDPFFTTKEVGEGTGLGLSICFGIVEQHGGTIRAESKLGEGTTFTVELPIISADQAMAEQAGSIPTK